MTLRPVPHCPPPQSDELLSSWIARLALSNHCSPEELCHYLGFRRGRAPETRREIADVDLNRLGALLRTTNVALEAMLLPPERGLVVQCIASSSFQTCSQCAIQVPGLELRHWRYVWSIKCEACGVALLPVGHVDDCSKGVLRNLRHRAAKGAMALKKVHYNGSVRQLRRINWAINIADLLYADLSPTSLTSLGQLQRFTLLAAIGLSLSRPLLFAALILRNDLSAVHQLHRALPYCRRALREVWKISLILNRRLPIAEEHPPERMEPTLREQTPQASPRTIEAMRLAINRLGERAPRHMLMDYAAGLLKEQT